MQNFEEYLNEVEKNKWKKCAYGLGLIGKSTLEDLFPKLDITFDLYCDKSQEVLNIYPISEGKKITYEQLINSEEDIALFVLVGVSKCDEIVKQFTDNKRLHIITWKQIENSDITIKAYFDIKDRLNYYISNRNQNNKKHNVICENKIAVYTYITGNYDKLNKIEKTEKNCDYYLITDMCEVDIGENSGYKLLNYLDVAPKNLKTGKEINRYCKSHGYELFPQYDYSIYIDGSLKILANICLLIDYIGAKGLAMHSFPDGDDIYSHALSLSIRRRIKKNDASLEIYNIAKDGFPRHYGMCECGVIVSDHHNEMGKKLLNEWFDYYHNALAKRDQIYLPYILWKNGIEVMDIATIPGNLRNNGHFEMIGSHTGFQK